MPEKAITHAVTIAVLITPVVNEMHFPVVTVETRVSEMSIVCFAIIDLARTTWMSTIEPLR